MVGSQSDNKNHASTESNDGVAINKCPECGGSVAEGHLETPGHGYPRVFVSLEDNKSEPMSFAVSAFVCLDCGHILLKAYLENISL